MWGGVADGSTYLRVGLCMYVHICAGIDVRIRNALAVGKRSLGGRIMYVILTHDSALLFLFL